MERIKCATFDKKMQDRIPKEIKDKMKADRAKAEKEQETKAKTLPIQNVSNSFIPILEQRIATIKSEPDGIVRETMIDNLLIGINDC